MKLKTARPYQFEAIDKMLELRKKAEFGVGLESPTGTGKSIMMAMLAERLASQGKSVLILAHRKELVEGNAAAVEAVTGERCYMELNTKHRMHHGDWKELKDNGGICSASVDTLQGRRLRGMPADLFDEIICDEGHHVRPLTKSQLGEPCKNCEGTGVIADDEGGPVEKCESCEGKGKLYETGSKYIKVKTHFKVPVWYGLSGTLHRGDSKGRNIMGRVFDQVYSTGTAFDFIDQGWLVDVAILHMAAVAVHLDFSKLSKKGFVTDKQAQEVWQTHKLEALSALRHGMSEQCGDRTTLIFSPKVQHAKWVTEFIQQADTNIYPNMGPETADYVASYALDDEMKKLPYDEGRRTSVIERLRSKRLQWCANQGVFTEGTDIPSVSALVMCRVTESINLMKQMVGRGLRTLSGTLDGLENATAQERKAAIAASEKKNCLILDFVGAMGDGKAKKLASPTMMADYTKSWGREQQEMAKKYWAVMWEKGRAPTLTEAREEIEEATSAWMQGVRAMLMEARESVTWEVTEIDPRGERKNVATPQFQQVAGGVTEPQARFIVSLQNTLKDQRYTFNEIMHFTKKEAADYIHELKELRDMLPAPKWMYKYFRENGLHPMPYSWGEGQAMIDEHKKRK